MLAGAGEVGAGPSKTNTMEELRQSQYKRTGAKTATERRTLRSIQVSWFRYRLLINWNVSIFTTFVLGWPKEG